ncbi:MAG TPA: DNA-3-methyladenine glycosylase [Candidatus Paceibacterota bacterium]
MQDPHEASRKHLLKDAHLGAFIKAHGPLEHRRPHHGGAFQSLAEAVIYQQLSGKAADTINTRFKALWPKKKFPTPDDVLRIKIEKLRAVGLSGQKSVYLKDLAAKFLDGTIDEKKFKHMSDQEVVAHVTAVKGVGVWTAQMFLMFTLNRPDVLPTGDLAIQKAFKKLFNLRALPKPDRMEKLSRAWAGHRTVACFYLWRMMDTKTAQ